MPDTNAKLLIDNFPLNIMQPGSTLYVGMFYTQVTVVRSFRLEHLNTEQHRNAQ